MSVSARGRFGRADAVWLLLLVTVFLSLALLGANRLGLWQPWETEYALMARDFGTVEEWSLTQTLRDAGFSPDDEQPLIWARQNGNWLVPENLAGDEVRKPWLMTLLLGVGYTIGDGSELGLRLPLVALGLLTLLALYGTLRAFVRPGRAFAAALVTGTAPMFLMSACNLAGVMISTSVTTLALCAYALALCRNGRTLWLLPAGLLTGFSLWAGGITALLLVLGTVACYGLWTLRDGWRRILQPVPLVAIAVAALVTIGPGLRAWASVGFNEAKDSIGMFIPLGVCLVALVMAWTSDRFGRHGAFGLLLVVAGALAVSVPPILAYLDAVPASDFGDFLDASRTAFSGGDTRALSAITWPSEHLSGFLLYNDLLGDMGSRQHISFDLFIRQIGFAAYPYTMFVPFGLAYLTQTIVPEPGDEAAAGSDDAGSADTAGLKMLLMAWFAVALGLSGISATLSRHLLFQGIVPMALPVGLLLTDRGYLRALRRNRTVQYLIGFGCVCVLFVLTKDLRTTQNLEFHIHGPEVLYEFLLVDHRSEQFPMVYKMTGMSRFMLLWTGLVAVYFWMLLAFQDELADRVDGWARRPVKITRWWAWPLWPVIVVAKIFTRYVFIPINRALAVLLWPIRAILTNSKGFAVAIVVSFLVFAGATATAYLPGLTDHLSIKGVVDTYRTLAEDGEVLYWVGGSDRRLTYYLADETVANEAGTDNSIDEIRSVAGLRPHYCGDESRMWAFVPRESLPQAYYEVRRDGGDEECRDDRDLVVLNADSSRYVLVSNRLRSEREDGRVEVNENPLAEHVFTRETLPQDSDPHACFGGFRWAVAQIEEAGVCPTWGLLTPDVQYTFDDKLRFLGYRMMGEDGEPVTRAGSGDVVYLETYFEVLGRVTSNREMFVHIDFGGQRINGDHDVCDGEFPMNYWVPGEIVRDRFKLVIDRGSTEGDYAILFGFFSGDNRMTVAPAIADDRVNAGTFHITGGL